MTTPRHLGEIIFQPARTAHGFHQHLHSLAAKCADGGQTVIGATQDSGPKTRKSRQAIRVSAHQHYFCPELREGLACPLPDETIAEDDGQLPRLNRRTGATIITHLRQHESGKSQGIDPCRQRQQRTLRANRRRNVSGKLIIKHAANFTHRGEHPITRSKTLHRSTDLPHPANFLIAGNQGKRSGITRPPSDVARNPLPAEERALRPVANP